MRALSICLAIFLLPHAVLAEPWADKLGPHLKRIARSSPEPEKIAAAIRSLPPFVRADRDAAEPALYVLAELDGGEIEQKLRGLAAEVRGRVGRIASLKVPASNLVDLASLKEIRWLKAARRYEPTLDYSTGPMAVDSDTANTSIGAWGSGVVVGVVDTGVDWTHDDFRNPDGTSRIIASWDQTVSDPSYPPPPGFSFGALFVKSDIDDALATSGTLPTDDIFGHGSHVAGIAAGNGRRTGNGVPEGTFAGVAPRADIVSVKVFEGTGADFCDECDLVAALQFIEQVAAAEGKPWVGNMSLGATLGPHDGTDPVELAIDDLVGPGRAGAQIVLSAGNTGYDGRAFHWEAVPVQGVTETNTFNLPDNDANSGGENDFIWIDLWYDGADSFTISIVAPDATTVSASTGEDSGVVCTTAGAIHIDASNAPDAANGDNEAFIQIWDSSSCDPLIEPMPGSWTIEIHPDVVGGSGEPFDLWNEATARGRSYAVMGSYSLVKIINTPANGRNLLTAGSWVSEDQWTNANDPPTTTGPCCSTTEPGSRSFFSSVGPTRDGRIKPDISAPGEWVGSTISSDMTPPGLDWQERDGEHWNARGTSMSAPHVAGVLALLLGINPELNGGELKSAIERSAQSDSFTGTTPNNEWGHGKLHALEAVYEGSAMVTDLAVPPEGGFTGTSSPLMLSYNVYRGDLASISEIYYGDCFLRDLPSADFTDDEPLPGGSGFFYLVTGVYSDPLTAAEIEGSLGTDGEGRTRPNDSPCP